LPPPAQLIKAAAAGRPERPLFVPLASLAAAALQDLEPRAFLFDATKLSNLVNELTRAARADAAVAEFGTYWDAEALGFELDWSGAALPSPAKLREPPVAVDIAVAGRAPVLLEAVKRLAVLGGPDGVVAAGVTGPATLSRLSGGRLGVREAAERQLPAVRALCEAGARLVWLVEHGEPGEDAGEVAGALGPLLGTIRFYGGLAVLHLSDAADAWLPIAEHRPAAVTCFDPGAAPGLAELAHAGEILYGVAAEPGPPTAAARELAGGAMCALVTHSRELGGTVPGRDVSAVIDDLRGLAWPA
jgi:hypothetical protein